MLGNLHAVQGRRLQGLASVQPYQPRQRPPFLRFHQGHPSESRCTSAVTEGYFWASSWSPKPVLSGVEGPALSLSKGMPKRPKVRQTSAGQVRAGQGSSKIIAAPTFPKLAQLWTGQVGAARAGQGSSKIIAAPTFPKLAQLWTGQAGQLGQVFEKALSPQ